MEGDRGTHSPAGWCPPSGVGPAAAVAFFCRTSPCLLLASSLPGLPALGQRKPTSPPVFSPVHKPLLHGALLPSSSRATSVAPSSESFEDSCSLLFMLALVCRGVGGIPPGCSLDLVVPHTLPASHFRSFAMWRKLAPKQLRSTLRFCHFACNGETEIETRLKQGENKNKASPSA